jgi:histidine triad (HIT) family protein
MPPSRNYNKQISDFRFGLFWIEGSLSVSQFFSLPVAQRPVSENWETEERETDQLPGSRMDCAFCRIVTGEVKDYTVFEDAVSLAFLDHRPLFPGHCLLISRRHLETLADVPAELIPALFSNAQLLARAMEEGMGAEGSFVAINNRVSQSVPHLHIHVVPRRRKDGLRGFFWPRQKYKDEAAILEVQAALRSAIGRLQSGV